MNSDHHPLMDYDLDTQRSPVLGLVVHYKRYWNTLKILKKAIFKLSLVKFLKLILDILALEVNLTLILNVTIYPR